MLLEELRISAGDRSAASEKLRILQAVAQEHASTRGEIARVLSIRPTTVSDLVADLLASRLLTENTSSPSGRGRPAQRLMANADRLVAIVFQIASQDIRATAVNLDGTVIAMQSLRMEEGTNAAEMTAGFRSLYDAVAARIPPAMELCGLSISLTGVLDAPSGRWLFSSRWPRLGSLDLRQAFDDIGLPVAITRNLDLELAARLARTDKREGGTLLLHWGYGIGSSFIVDGIAVNRQEGRFGEIGHWRFRSGDRTCHCGAVGCLETKAALWAILPELSSIWPELEHDEAVLAGQMPYLDLLAVRAVDEALDAVIAALGNVCRLLFPRRIIVSGPFVANAHLWDEFRTRFQKEGVMRGTNLPDLVADQRSASLERNAAAYLVLNDAVAKLLE